MAFDFGTKRLGIAVGQSITCTATPLTTLPVKNGIPHWPNLDVLIHEWQPEGLIVGLPLHSDDSPSTTSIKAQQLGESLAKRYGLCVFYMEERLTSVEAENRLKESPLLAQTHQGKDAVAASIILESWLRDAFGKTHV